MKKLLLGLFAISALTAAFAQNNNKVRIRITEPLSGSTATSGQPILFRFWIRNIDTVTLTGNTVVAVSLGSFNGTTFTNQTPVTALTGVNIAPGDSQEFTRSYTITMSGGASGNIGIALAAWYIDGTNATLNSIAPIILNMYNSVSEAAKAGKSVKVYPNPARDVLNIDLDYNKEKVITVFDITGKLIETIKNNDEQTTINVGNYNKGLYMYEIRTTGGELIKSGKFNVAH